MSQYILIASHIFLCIFPISRKFSLYTGLLIVMLFVEDILVNTDFFSMNNILLSIGGYFITIMYMHIYSVIYSFRSLSKAMFVKLTLNFIEYALIFAEEIIWRGYIQYLVLKFFYVSISTKSIIDGICIILISLFFTISHNMNAETKQKIELFIFSCLLGFIYYYTNNIILVVVCHISRNNYIKNILLSNGESQNE